MRTALGASRLRVVALVCREGFAVAVAGLAGGVVAAAAATHFIQALLFGIEPLDPWSFAIAPVILLAVAGLACVVPARRAASTDPVIALRCE